MRNQAVILAAGESSRFWPLNQRHKSLLKIMGQPLICYTIKGLEKIGVKKIIIVQGPEKDIEKELKKYNLRANVEYVIQPEPKGTGNALWQVKNLIKGPFMVLNAERMDIQGIVSGERFPASKSILIGQKTKTSIWKT